MTRPGGAVNRPRLLGRLLAGRPFGPVALRPAVDVDAGEDSTWIARSTLPWLRIEAGQPWPGGRWIQLRYRAGELDDPVRPVLRIHRAAGAQDHAVLPGPVCGQGIWTGPLPPDVEGLSISPAARPGPFAFALDEVGVLSRPALVAGAFARQPSDTLGLLVQRLRGKARRSRHLLAAIWATTPIEHYAAWRAERARTLPGLAAPDGLTESPRVGILVDATAATGDELARTLRSLDGQAGTRPRSWTVSDVDATGAGAAASAIRQADAACGWLALVTAGDTLAPSALAAVAAAIRRDEAADLLYADQDVTAPDGRRRPVLQPDWSPRLLGAGWPPGGLVLVRTGLVPDLAAAILGGGRTGDLADRLSRVALAQPSPRIVHLRRILLHRRREPPRPPGASARAPALAARAPALPASPPLVSVIVPSRDRLELLRPCIAGLLGGTDYPELEVVIVDNGSREAETRAYYGSLTGEHRVTVIDRPGPFNYSALTNDGVAASRGEMLLLLNNDIEVLRPDWLRLLVAEALVPDVGAVGAKLLYPDGRIQHAGVVIGLGGAAGHIYRGRPDDGPGWMGRLSATHEVSAVTGACLAVARRKYEAVGGLDAEHLPVSFNDIDLCLKLRREGWRNLLVAEAVLIHNESASRGHDREGEKQARAERESRIFAERWLHVMRDDPYYHPALSLLRFEPALG